MSEKTNKIFPKRKKCPDYGGVHKKAIYSCTKTNTFIKLEELSALLKPLFSNKIINPDDCVCKNCYSRFTSLFSVSANIEVPNENIVNDHLNEFENELLDFNESNINDDLNEEKEPDFQPDEALLREEINDEIFRSKANISPLLNPSRVSTNSRRKYACRKRKQIVNSNAESTSAKLAKIYNTCCPKDDCACQEWISNFRSALNNCKNNPEKIRLLTLLPDSYDVNNISSVIPEVSKYMVQESKKLKSSKGIYSFRDPYLGHPLNEQDIKLAQDYFLNDDLDCSRQSPNKDDVITINENGLKVKKIKRYLTRSIREIYNIFREKNPNSKMSETKFYTLRPKWVLIDPPKEGCLCVYCANFELCLIALKNLKKDTTFNAKLVREELFSTIMCDSSSDKCIFDECKECPGPDEISAALLNLPNEEEVQFALWNNGELEKRTTSLNGFLIILREWTMKAKKHFRIKKVQQEKIRTIKEEIKSDPKKIIIHCDFAENWRVILQNEVQSAYWKTTQLSIFTAVCYYGDEAKSFAVVSDDTDHDTAHTLMALKRISIYLDSSEKFKSNKEEIIISDGATAHFKNRFQFYELRNSKKNKNWIFSATGHGKGACDGIGGLVKHYATHHNLQKSQLESITNADTFATTVQKYTKAITLLTIPADELKSFREKQIKRWDKVKVKAIKRIQKNHCWKFEKKKKKKIFLHGSNSST